MSLSDFGTRYDHEPVHEESADRLFERSWVESILERVRLRLADDYQRAQKKELFDLLEPHLSNRNDALPRAEISRRLNLSIAAVAMSLHRIAPTLRRTVTRGDCYHGRRFGRRR